MGVAKQPRCWSTVCQQCCSPAGNTRAYKLATHIALVQGFTPSNAVGNFIGCTLSGSPLGLPHRAIQREPRERLSVRCRYRAAREARHQLVHLQHWRACLQTGFVPMAKHAIVCNARRGGCSPGRQPHAG